MSQSLSLTNEVNEVKMELTKDITERIYSLIENARSDGKIRKGVNEVTKSLERGEAKLSISASDSSPAEIIMHLPLLAKEKSIMHVEVPSKTELGAAAGLPVATAAVAVVSADKKMMDTLLKDIKTLLGGGAKPAKKEEKPAKEEKVEEPKAEEKPAKEEKVEEPKAEEKPAKEEKVEEPKAEEKPAEESKEESPKAEQPVEESKKEAPAKKEEKPAKEEKVE